MQMSGGHLLNPGSTGLTLYKIFPFGNILAIESYIVHLPHHFFKSANSPRSERIGAFYDRNHPKHPPPVSAAGVFIVIVLRLQGEQPDPADKTPCQFFPLPPQRVQVISPLPLHL